MAKETQSEDAGKRFEAIEKRLQKAYVSGRLNTKEQSDFREHYLVTEERQVEVFIIEAFSLARKGLLKISVKRPAPGTRPH